MDLVGDGGGETPSDGHFFVGNEGVLGAPLHGYVAEDENSADGLAGLAEDGSAAVGDAYLGSVAADEDGVVRESDDASEALDLGDGVFHNLAGDLVEDMEDVFEESSFCLLEAPSG